MSTKRIILIFLGSALVVALGVVGYLYYRLNQPSDLPAHIPGGADKVYFANSGNIVQLVLSGKLKKGIGKIEYQKNEYLKNIPDLQKMGIDFLNGAAFVEYKGHRYIIVTLHDADQFAGNVASVDKHLLNPAEDHGKFRKVFARRDSFTLAWNEKLLVVFPKTKSNFRITDEYISEILGIRKDASLASNNRMMHAKNDHALMWFYDGNADLRISDPGELKGFIQYDSCFFIYATSNILKPYTNNVSFYEPDSAAHNFIYADTANRFTNKFMLQLAEMFIPAEMQKIKQLEFNKLRKVFTLQGKQVVENRVVSYVYDDDFNKREVATIQKDTVQKAFMSLVPPGNLWGAHFSSLPQPAFDSAAFNTYGIPDKVKLMAHFNQDFTKSFFPLDITYDIWLNYQQLAGFNEYRLLLKVENFGSVLNTGLIPEY